MDGKEKQGLLGASTRTVKIVLRVLYAFIVLVFIYYGLIDKVAPLDNEPLRFIESWTVTDDYGNTFVTGRSYIADKKYEMGATVYSTLPDNIEDNEFLFFVTRKDVAVYINGELRKDFVEERDVKIPGGSVKKFYMMVPLTAADSGAEIEMIRHSIVSSDQLVSESFVATRSGAFRYLLRNNGLSFVMASIILIFSFVVFVVSIIMRFWYKMKIYMMYGALGIMDLALWLITDSYLCPFIFGAYYVNGALNYMFCLMIPLAPAVYLNSVQQGRFKKSMSFIMLTSSINATLWPILHFTGVMPFYDIRNIENIIMALMAVVSIAILVYDAVKGNIENYKYTFTGFLAFLVCDLIELTMLLTTKFNDSFPMVAGLAFLLVFVVIQQVQDLRKISQERQKAIDISEAKTRFLASMSHEIRTPINAILGMNEMILRENSDKVIGEYSRSIKSSGKMLLMLVNDVLDFSKIEAGKLEIIESRFLMSEMLYDVVSLVKERADEKKLVFKVEITADIPNEVISDEFRIRQILVNLINNAVKYTDRGIVTLLLGGSFTAEGYDLSISVKDTGKGIKKEEQDTLFNAFTRADVKSNVNIEGTGLGLAIVKSIVDSMKGTIEVESEYGVGSDFKVVLPVKYSGNDILSSDFMEKRPDADAAPEGCNFTAPDAKILAVDDNQSNLTIVKLFLKRTGIKPDLVSSGTRAIELCKENKYDLIILDHMMPSPDGIETLHIIRSDAASLNKDTKAVVLTANAVAGSRQKYMAEGFDDYLTKPLDSKALEQVVMNMLPKDKVYEKKSNEPEAETEKRGDANMSELKKKLTSIPGLDFNTALCYCGGEEEILAEITADVAKEAPVRAERMRKNLAAKDIKAYGIDAHTVKSTMATMGLKALSERAKKHEFAAKGDDTEFIFGDAENFLNEYEEVCKKMM